MPSWINRLTDASADLVFLDVPRRVAKALLLRAETHGTADLGLTQTALPSSVGSSRQWVNQALHGLERRGWVAVDGRKVRIRDEAALRRFVEN